MAPAIPFENLILFFGASLLLAMSPGPDNIFVLTQSLLHGKKAGLLVTAGLCTGLLGHTAAATAGVSALLQASPVAFKVLKMFGASYLLYLAWQALSSANKPPGTQHWVATLFSRNTDEYFQPQSSYIFPSIFPAVRENRIWRYCATDDRIRLLFYTRHRHLL